MICIVQYLYTGKTQVAPNELDDFMNVAKKLKVLGFCDESNPIHIDTPDGSPLHSRSRSTEPKCEVISDESDNDNESVAAIVGQKTRNKRRRDENGNGNVGSSNWRVSDTEPSTSAKNVPRMQKRRCTNQNLNALSNNDVRMTPPSTLFPSNSELNGTSAHKDVASTSSNVVATRENGNAYFCYKIRIGQFK